MLNANQAGTALIGFVCVSATTATAPMLLWYFRRIYPDLLLLAITAFLLGTVGRSALPMVRFIIAGAIYGAAWVPALFIIAWVWHAPSESSAFILLLLTISLGIPFLLATSFFSLAGTLLCPMAPSLPETFRAGITAQVCFQSLLWWILSDFPS